MAAPVPVTIRNRTKLIVGIDYGTTYSGIGFVLSNASDFQDVKPWTTWPGMPTENNEYLCKAPTTYAYAFENEDLDNDVWGYEVEPGMNSCSWTKLLLDNAAAPTEYDDPFLAQAASNGLMRLPRGKTAEDVVTDYMKGLYNMFFEAVKSVWGEFTDFADVPFAIEYWVSVPATWSERAKVSTLKAAKTAGFGTREEDIVRLIPEPEAAAHLALKSSIHHVDDLVKENTGVLVCDCGGGTVDISTYHIKQVSPTLKMDEACVGVGAKCGGTYIDRNLYKLLTERFGTAFTSLPSDRIGPGSPFMTQFESKKKNFSTSTPRRRPAKLHLVMPNLKPEDVKVTEYDNRYHDILLTYDDMISCFDPVVKAILELIENQTTAVVANGFPAIQTLILVGGLGSSPYIREKVQEWCAERNIRVTTPFHGGWSAIVCGAVLRGLEGSLIEKKYCRKHYGHTLSKKYNPLTDFNFNANKRHLWIDEFTDKEMQLSGFMFWEMAKGLIIDSTSEFQSHFVMQFQEGHSMTISHDLYSCSLDTAPDTIENDRVEVEGTIKASFADIGLSNLEFKINSDGQKVYRISFTLAIALGAEEGTLQCRLLTRGREIGQATITFSSS